MKVFIAYSSRDRELVANVTVLLHEEGHEVLDPMDIKSDRDIISQISADIRSADALIAVVTAGNPNIFYELGLASGANVPTLIAAPAGEVLPAALAGVPYVLLLGDILRDAQTIVQRTNKLLKPLPALPREFESAEATLRAALREPAVLESLSPMVFERLIMELFKERGFTVTATTPTRDAGFDFLFESNTEREPVVVEVKKLSRQSRVSVETVRRFMSVISAVGASLGVLVAASGYTAAALALAVGSPIVLRTLEEVLAAKSEKELLEANMAKTYRKKQRSDTWHFCSNCSKWPTSNYEERSSKPASGELCNECHAKQRDRVCR